MSPVTIKKDVPRISDSSSVYCWFIDECVVSVVPREPRTPGEISGPSQIHPEVSQRVLFHWCLDSRLPADSKYLLPSYKIESLLTSVPDPRLPLYRIRSWASCPTHLTRTSPFPLRPSESWDPGVTPKTWSRILIFLHTASEKDRESKPRNRMIYFLTDRHTIKTFCGTTTVLGLLPSPMSWGKSWKVSVSSPHPALQVTAFRNLVWCISREFRGWVFTSRPRTLNPLIHLSTTTTQKGPRF